jgi:hypothetical protein
MVRKQGDKSVDTENDWSGLFTHSGEWLAWLRVLSNIVWKKVFSVVKIEHKVCEIAAHIYAVFYEISFS